MEGHYSNAACFKCGGCTPTIKCLINGSETIFCNVTCLSTYTNKDKEVSPEVKELREYLVNTFKTVEHDARGSHQRILVYGALRDFKVVDNNYTIVELIHQTDDVKRLRLAKDLLSQTLTCTIL